jgi:hypothetical protein
MGVFVSLFKTSIFFLKVLEKYTRWETNQPPLSMPQDRVGYNAPVVTKFTKARVDAATAKKHCLGLWIPPMLISLENNTFVARFVT